MAALMPSSVVALYEIIVNGGISLIARMNFDEPVILAGMPAGRLIDQLGNTHRPVSAAPHIAPDDDLVDYVDLHFHMFPKWGPLSLFFEFDDPNIMNVATDPLSAGTYALT